MKIICIGQNYNLENNKTSEPFIFIKPDTALHHCELPFFIPEFSKEIHFEAELVVKISKNGKFISEKFAKNYYQQISLGIDFTAVDIQQKLKEKSLPWEISKAFDSSAVVGEFLPKEVFLEQEIPFYLQKNDKIVQKSSSKEMILGFDKIISLVSSYFTLKQGDLIFTGTPFGASKIEKGDIFKGFLAEKQVFSLQIK